MLRVLMIRLIPIKGSISDTGRGYGRTIFRRSYVQRTMWRNRWPLILAGLSPSTQHPAPGVHFLAALARCFPLESFATQEI
jgi:hypothetical protein